MPIYFENMKHKPLLRTGCSKDYCSNNPILLLLPVFCLKKKWISGLIWRANIDEAK